MTADAAFIACSKTKADAPAPAGALYSSPLFRKSIQAAMDCARKIFILSAEHGVVAPSTMLAPYDTTLKRMSLAQRRDWGRRVGESLRQYAAPSSSIELFCGDEYISPIAQDMERLRYKVSNRLAGMSLGQRLRELATLNGEVELRRTKSRFDKAIYQLWIAQRGGRLLGETSGRQQWPERGVYFLLDPQVPAANGRMPRIIRVGTHAVSDGSKTTLWDRISTHRGTGAGGGSHRSSIFRLHVGRALVSRNPDLLAKGGHTWGQGQSAPADVRIAERHIEEAVSVTLGAMRLLWVDIPDAASPTSQRSYIERNSIALLSRVGLLSSYGSQRWLGRYSPEWKIASSGLWNLNHVFSRVDPEFCDVFEATVQYTLHQQTKTGEAALSALPGINKIVEPQLTLLSEDTQSRATHTNSDRSVKKLSEADRASQGTIKKASTGTNLRRRRK